LGKKKKVSIKSPHPESSSGQALTSPFETFKGGKFSKAVIPVKTGIQKSIENTGFQPSLE
jgi:hypothetical protein